MALNVVLVPPDATTQLGAGTNTVSGAADADSAWSDSSDTSYVQLAARVRNDTEVVRVSFPTPVVPADAKVLSVAIRRRVLTVADGSSQPVCLHWLRTLEGEILVEGQELTPKKDPFTTLCPTDTAGGTYVDESLGARTSTATGAAWDVNTNLTSGRFFYDYGRGDDFGGNHRVSKVLAAVTYQQQSTVTLTGPTGTIAGTQPTVTWEWDSPDSQPQQGFRVVVYTDAQAADVDFEPFESTALQDSGDQLGEDLQWQFEEAIPDGNYVVYVRGYAKWAGPGRFPTEPDSVTFTRDVSTGGDEPPNATLSSATFDPDNDRVAVTMVPSSGGPVTAAYTIQVSRDGGVTYTSPPSFTRVQANGMTPVTVFDYLAPISATSKYRVLSYSQPSGVFVAAAAPSNVGTALTYGDTWRLADPANPLNNCIVTPVAAGKDGKQNKVTFPRLAASFQTLGGAGEQPPIVVTGSTSGEAGTLTLWFADEQMDNWPAFKALMQSGHTLLLKKSFAEQLWVALAVGPNTQDPELTYGDVPGHPERVYWRKITLGYTQTRPPNYY